MPWIGNHTSSFVIPICLRHSRVIRTEMTRNWRADGKPLERNMEYRLRVRRYCHRAFFPCARHRLYVAESFPACNQSGITFHTTACLCQILLRSAVCFMTRIFDLCEFPVPSRQCRTCGTGSVFVHNTTRRPPSRYVYDGTFHHNHGYLFLKGRSSGQSTHVFRKCSTSISSPPSSVKQ